MRNTTTFTTYPTAAKTGKLDTVEVGCSIKGGDLSSQPEGVVVKIPHYLLSSVACRGIPMSYRREKTYLRIGNISINNDTINATTIRRKNKLLACIIIGCTCYIGFVILAKIAHAMSKPVPVRVWGTNPFEKKL